MFEWSWKPRGNLRYLKVVLPPKKTVDTAAGFSFGRRLGPLEVGFCRLGGFGNEAPTTVVGNGSLAPTKPGKKQA